MPENDHSAHQQAMTCQELLPLLSEYVDGTLAEELCEAMRSHTTNCKPCTAFFEAFTKTIELYQQKPPVSVPQHVKSDLRASLQTCKDALRNT